MLGTYKVFYVQHVIENVTHNNMEHCLMRSTFMVNWFMFGISNMRTTFIIEILNNWRYISVFLAFDFCRFCVVTTRFFHPRHNGQWPPTSKYFYTRSYPLHYFLILIREKELVYFIELIYIKELVLCLFPSCCFNVKWSSEGNSLNRLVRSGIRLYMWDVFSTNATIHILVFQGHWT